MTARGVSLQHSLIQTSYAKTLIEYFFAFSLSVLCTILVLQLWKLQWLYIPFVYTGDANYFRGDWVYYAMTIKSTITTGWSLL
ncbi:MAG TPA: hypothetical protein VMR37_05475, partial [Rhabdochlamydiaceae bacterium]|nr:hypothetical protein [Rhabdochlamydiaceae bacterium]